MHGTEQIGL